MTFCDPKRNGRKMRSKRKTMKNPPSILKAIQNILYLSTCDTQNFDVVSVFSREFLFSSVFMRSESREERNFSMKILSISKKTRKKNHPHRASKYLCRDVLFWGNTVASMRLWVRWKFDDERGKLAENRWIWENPKCLETS